MSADVRVVEEPATSPAAQLCLGRYYRELEKRFDGGFDPGKSVLQSLDAFAPPRGCFLVLYLAGEPVGCGGFTPLGEDSAYLKRMWIAGETRGHGLGRRLLEELEKRARSAGYGFAKLETNKALPEAQQLYRSAGYAEVAPFNQEHYAHHWFEKRLN